jgi:hypothetical protein
VSLGASTANLERENSMFETLTDTKTAAKQILAGARVDLSRPNEGEGRPTGDCAYNDAAHAFVESGKVAAQQAARDVGRTDTDPLKRAEANGTVTAKTLRLNGERPCHDGPSHTPRQSCQSAAVRGPTPKKSGEVLMANPCWADASPRSIIDPPPPTPEITPPDPPPPRPVEVPPGAPTPVGPPLDPTPPPPPITVGRRF